MKTSWLAPLVAFVAVSIGGFVYWNQVPAEPAGGTPAAPVVKQTPGQLQLPIRQAFLFSSGVGYFQREGEVDGNSRIDLTFLAADVNDLLKSLVLQDLNGGTINSISYDSQDPIEKTLRSFALDFTGNPSFGEILNQARGEKVEVVLQQSTVTQPGTLTGTIMGMESQRQPHGRDAVIDVDFLNLWCAEGIRSLKLSDIQRVRFLNPTIESEVKRALEVLAASHDTQKKSVSLNFTGEGKRRVRVGYVVENPLWKTSYRLVLNQNGKAFLQGWAVVENTSDEDWKDVKMSLVSGRPISFQMNLYQPLYIPRPTVEPELFASLRPPTYNAAMDGPVPTGGNPAPAQDPSHANMGGYNRYKPAAAGFLQGVGQPGGFNLPSRNIANNDVNFLMNKLTYEQLRERQMQQKELIKQAKNAGESWTINPAEGVHSLASAEEIGDYFRYDIEQPVSLPRQKSAMLPIIQKDVEAKKVSIFNETVHTKFPLLGLKFKNTSNNHLMQGPLTVFESGTYAGDSRLLDLQPNEERLISYAIDLATEVKADGKKDADQLTDVKVVKGILHATHKLRKTRTYQVKNRSDQDRILIIEHPFDPNWKLVTPEKPSERSRDVYRFELVVPAGKSLSHEVVEEQSLLSRIAIASTDDRSIQVFAASSATEPKVKEALEKALSLRQAVVNTQRDLALAQAQLKEINEDQARLRANLRELPPASDTYKRYIKKLDTQETEIEDLRTHVKVLQTQEKEQQKAYEDYLAALTVGK